MEITSAIGMSIYPISKVLGDYLVNSVGEVGSNHTPVNYSGINQILLSQWKYMKTTSSLRKLVRDVEEGNTPMMVAQQAIAAYNKRTGGEITFKELIEETLERPSNTIFSPMADPWIFYKTKKEYNIYNLLDMEIPKIPGNLMEFERYFLPLAEFMDVLWFVDSSNDTTGDILMVVKNNFTDIREVVLDTRTTTEVKNRFNLAENYYYFHPEFEGETVAETYVLSPELEQTLRMELEFPHLV